MKAVSLWIGLMFTLGSSVQACEDFNLVGQGDLKKFFIKVYEAQYRVSDDGHQCLTISYEVEISKHQLLEATALSWGHLGLTDEQVDQYIARLEPIYTDVADGDQFKVVASGDEAVFFFNSEMVGIVDSEGFGRHFLDIWLHEGSKNPGLSRELRGE